jgi:hypothetical protein
MMSMIEPAAAAWRLDMVSSPGRVTALQAMGGEVAIAVGASWYRLAADGAKLEPAAAPRRMAVPAGGLEDGTVAVGRGIVARAWLAEPTGRYRHGILGDTVEAASLVIERRDGGRAVVSSGAEAVFEDLSPRLVEIDGTERIVVVKSYLDRGSSLAIVDPAAGSIVAETPPVGHANAWVHPVGIADFDGDGATDIALVRQPHVLGRLELWSFRGGLLQKIAEVPDVSTHAIGSRALGMSAVADFDGDGRPDLAVPSLDRRALRLIAFAPRPREIVRVALPSRAATDFGMVMRRGRVALIAGLENGALVLLHDGSRAAGSR